MSKLIKVAYVGKKPTAFDNVAKSGKIWSGHGDVQEVTDVQAKALLKYPDQWALVDQADAAQVNAPQSIKSTDAEGAEVTIDPDDLKTSVEKMSVAQLKAYAMETYGKTVEGKTRKLIMDEVEELIRTAQPVAIK